MKKGLTLIEVILSIALISIIAISFLPGITFGYKNLIDSKKFTVDAFEAQLEIEKIMEEKRNKVLSNAFGKTIFGVSVTGQSIEISVKDHGEIHVFQTQKKEEYPVPKIVASINTGLTSIVRLSALNNTTETIPVPAIINMFTGSNQLDANRNFLVDNKYYKIDNPKIHLVNVNRWYTSSLVGYSEGSVMDNYFIIKEWNAARPLIGYEESKTLKTIPNIQNDPDYNRLKFSEIKNGLGLSDTDLINQYGNRYYYYSVTPFAISGKIGVEEYSNAIYVQAPRIEIEKAVFGLRDNQINIYFKDGIEDTFMAERISLNESLGNIVSVSRDVSNNKVMILELNKTISQNLEIEGNALNLGSVRSSLYGAIHIWSTDNKPLGEFKIVQHVPIKEWNFNNNTEGWVAQQHIDQFVWQTGGYIGGNIKGIDPRFLSPATLNINTDQVNKIRIRLKNNSASSMAQIFYNTSVGGFAEVRHIDFPIIPNSDFTEYIIDVGSAASWSGTLKQFRIDPTMGVSEGSFSIDDIKFYD